MKAFCFKITSFLLAWIVLLSTLSFTLNQHFCGDHLMNTAWFAKAQSCSLMANNEACSLNAGKSDPTSEKTVLEKSCCKEVTQTFDGQKVLKHSFEDMTLDQQVFLVSFAYAYIAIFEGDDSDRDLFIDYTPPPLIEDVLILNQTFLI